MNERRRVVLVVDDEESMRYFLRKTLRREGYEVLEAEDGPAAIERAHAHAPDLALLDIRMPGMDGVALMRALRATLPRLPVILMTAYGSVENALQAMKQGATDYVTKPFRIDEIRTTVAKALRVDGGAGPRPTIRDVARVQRGAASASPLGAAGSATRATGALPRESVETPERDLVPWLRERVAARGLPFPGDAAAGDASLRDVVRMAELVYSDELLRLTSGNVSRAAEIAGITRPNMHRKVTDLGLVAGDYRPGAARRRPGASGHREEER